LWGKAMGLNLTDFAVIVFWPNSAHTTGLHFLFENMKRMKQVPHFNM
jgi:hypothetical protein